MKYANKNTLDARTTYFNSHVHMKRGYITTAQKVAQNDFG